MRNIAKLSLISLFATKLAFAATATTTFNVTATVQSGCNTLTANTLAFGNYDPFAATPTDQSNNIQVSCTNGTPYSIALNAGTTSGGTIANRLMANGASTLNYNIYTASARTTIWGNGTGGSSVVSGTGSGAAQSYTAYGRIPASQASSLVGNYSDVITVTVTY